MRLAYTNFHLGWGGQPQQVLLLARAMRERGHSVRVFSPPGSILAERAAEAGLATETGCAFRRGFRPLSLWRDVRALRQTLLEAETELLHCHGSQDTWTVLLAARGRARVPVVRTKHNSYPAARHPANRWLYNRGLAGTIAVAGPIRDGLLAGGFVRPERVAVVHAGLEDAFAADAPRARAEVRAELGVPPRAKLIGLVGRLAPDKGQDTLLEALRTVRGRIPEAHVLLVGTGGDWDRIRERVETLGLGGHVTMPGFREDVRDLTAALDVAVLAARACDASSTVVKEAMALGVPVVATDVGGTREILDGGACGLLVEPGDAGALAGGLLDTLEDPDATRARTERARTRVERFLASSIAEATEAIYRRILEGCPPAGETS